MINEGLGDVYFEWVDTSSKRIYFYIYSEGNVNFNLQVGDKIIMSIYQSWCDSNWNDYVSFDTGEFLTTVTEVNMASSYIAISDMPISNEPPDNVHTILDYAYISNFFVLSGAYKKNGNGSVTMGSSSTGIGSFSANYGNASSYSSAALNHGNANGSSSFSCNGSSATGQYSFAANSASANQYNSSAFNDSNCNGYCSASFNYGRTAGRAIKCTAMSSTAKTLTAASGENISGLAGNKVLVRYKNNGNTIIHTIADVSSVSGQTIYLSSDTNLGWGGYGEALISDGYIFRIEASNGYNLAAYCRVSTGSDDQLESLNAQKEHYEKFIKSNPDWEFAGLYYDEGITGTKKEKRKGLQSMITACELRQIDFIVTKSISRFSRNTMDCLEMVRKLIDLGIFMYFEKENLNTQSMESELILSILSSMAQDESVSISQNSKWGIKQRFKNGTYKIAYPPYGYANVNGSMEVVPAEAEIIKKIFRDTLSGKGCYTVARELNESGVPAKKGGKWTGTTILSILKNEKYTGDVLFQKTYTDSQFNRHCNRGQHEQYFVPNHHEAIINHKDFDAVQQVIAQRGKEKNINEDSSKYLKRYALSGKIICGNCGARFKRRTHYTNKGSYTAWTCQTHIEHKDICTMKYINENDIHHAFVLMMNKLEFGYKTLLVPLRQGLKEMSSESRIAALVDLDKRVEKNADRKRIISELVGKGFLDAALFNKELAEIAAEAEILKEERKRLQCAISGNNEQVSELEGLMRFISKKPNVIEFDESLFERFVDSIIVYTRDEVGFRMKCGITLRERLVN